MKRTIWVATFLLFLFLPTIGWGQGSDDSDGWTRSDDSNDWAKSDDSNDWAKSDEPESNAVSGNIDGKFRLGFYTSIFQYTYVKVTDEDSGQHAVGLTNKYPSLNLDMAYGVSNSFYMGMDFSLVYLEGPYLDMGDPILRGIGGGTDFTDVFSSDISSVLIIGLRPKIRYVAKGWKAGPIQIRQAFGMFFTYHHYSYQVEDLNEDIGESRFGPGGDFGIHSFLARYVSIDLFLYLSYLYKLKMEKEISGSSSETHISPDSTTYSHTSYNIHVKSPAMHFIDLGITLGVSFWI